MTGFATSMSEMYVDCFGFTEEEVFAALDEYGMQDIACGS